MSTTTFKTKAAALAHVQALIAGTKKHLPTGSFTIGSTAYSAASIVQVLQGLADTMLARSAAEVSSGEFWIRDVEEIRDLIVNRQKPLCLLG